MGLVGPSPQSHLVNDRNYHTTFPTQAFMDEQLIKIVGTGNKMTRLLSVKFCAKLFYVFANDTGKQNYEIIGKRGIGELTHYVHYLHMSNNGLTRI